jgi:hypothetical protein
MSPTIPAATLPGFLAGAVLALGAAAPGVTHAAADREAGLAASVAGYYGLATWVDIFDPGPWQHPERAVRGWAGRGVDTVFVQTSNYRQPRAVHRPAMLERMLAAAHRRGMRVIAWYLPGFADLQRDWLRVRSAVRYAGAGGHRFDGFALDIEATAVRSIAARNRRMLDLTRRLRSLVGDEYALGAIVPDPVTQRYWPSFPWRAVVKRFDVVLPMSYWTFHSRGEAAVYRHARESLRSIRGRSRDRSVPIHLIGGLASHASVAEVRGFARAAVDFGAAGASLYDAPITRSGQWRQMAALGPLRSEVE